jgi:hypothetical protein
LRLLLQGFFKALVYPRLFKLKLLNEIRQCQFASQSRRLITAKASAFDPHAYRFAASENSPAPRRRVGRLARRDYEVSHEVSPMVQFL